MTISEATARCWAEIDLDALCENYRQACSMAREVVCVLKADAYGMGAAVVGPALFEAGARIFAVADGDEAEELMDACPGADVLVLGHVGTGQARRLNLRRAMFTLYSVSQGELLAAVAREQNLPVRVHVKLDTGLYRLGFSGGGAADEIAALHRTGRFQMEGLFTHLALHDRESDEKQFARFAQIESELSDRGVTFAKAHLLDSIGMVRYPDWRRDAVRCGAWLYGVCPARYDHPERCRPVAKFKARIAQIHFVPAGERIGYDDDHCLARDTRVATLTAGYSDGAPRLRHSGAVEIRGRRAGVLGLVCMDQMMADVTDVLDAQPGDEVTFFGGLISLDEYAAQGALNRNEALARLTRRVPRIYLQNGEAKAVGRF